MSKIADCGGSAMFKERKSRLKFGSGSEVSSTMNTSSSNKKRALSKLSFADDNEKEEAITEDVQVNVEVFYIENDSLPEENHYVFAYRIRLKNLGLL